MRTTVDIPDALYRQLKARAASEGRSVKALLLQAAEHVVKPTASSRTHRVRVPLIPSRHPRSLRLDNARIYDLIVLP